MSGEPRQAGRAPRAVRLDPASETAARDIAVVAETEAIDVGEPVPQAVRPRRGFSLGTVFVAGLAGFLTLALGAWIENTVQGLMARNPALGYAALTCAALAALALLAMLVRVARDILRERRVEAMHARGAALMAGGTLDEAKALAAEVAALYGGRPGMAAGRGELDAALPQLFAPRDVLAVTERTLLSPLDAQAQALVAQASRRVSLVTAVSPRALVDVVFVLIACARLLRAVAGVYAGRPGALGLMRLARQVMSHLVLTGGIAAGDAVIQQVVGQGLAARLSAKLGEGVLNGLLTARIGLSAIAVCRPLPFVEAPAPTLGDVAGDLSSWRTAPEAG